MKAQTSPDVVLVGAGVMSATLGMLLKQLNPGTTIEVFESLDLVAGESSNAWNNAGTGHAALCELNYTPQRDDGSVEVSKAIAINESFEVSKQFWSYLVGAGVLSAPDGFIRAVPHLSFVRGDDNVDFLRKRYDQLQRHHLFCQMQYSEDPTELTTWMPLVMDGRARGESVAATRALLGTDVNFGSLSRSMFDWLQKQDGVAVHLSHRVSGLNRCADNRWHVHFQNKAAGTKRTAAANFVFLGAGGGALPLLQKADIPEAKGFGGFPVSGQWLRCDRAEVVERHNAKVYGKAAVGSPPMSVPHLDTRVIDGKRSLLFGPVRGLFDKIPEARVALRSAGICQAGQSPAVALGGPRQCGSHPVPDRSGPAISERSPGSAQRVRSHRPKAGLAPRSRRPARPNHQERPRSRRDPPVWHGSGVLGGWLDRGVVGGVARRLDLRFNYASGHRALLQGAFCHGRLADKA